MCLHDPGLRSDQTLHDLVGTLVRPVGVQRISDEVEPSDLALLGLLVEDGGCRPRLGRVEHIRSIVL
jgi:hypothetical protein